MTVLTSSLDFKLFAKCLLFSPKPGPLFNSNSLWLAYLLLFVTNHLVGFGSAS